MRHRLFCIALLVLVAQAGLWAQVVPQAKVDLLIEFLALTRAKEKFEIGQVEGFKMGFDMSPGAKTMPEEKKEQIYTIAARVFSAEMPWDVYQERLIPIMAELHTEEHLQAINAFLRTPAGVALVESELAGIGPSLRLGGEFGQRAIPKLIEALQGVE